MCQVVAEIGWNFLGDMALAEQMIIEASKAGADFVKFQSWSVKNLKSGPWDTDGRRQIYEKAELSIDQHWHLMKICSDWNIQFLTSVFCKEDAEKIRILNCESVKVPSPEIANIPLLEYVAQNFDRVYLSTGAATYAEIKTAVEVLGVTRNNESRPHIDTILLHCVSAYPCPSTKINLPRIMRLKEKFNQPRVGFGYSGHGEGVFDAIAAQDYGIEVVEKHFTTDKNLPGRDNKFAILPHELKYLCDYISHRWDMGASPFTEYDVAEEEVRNVYRGRWQS